MGERREQRIRTIIPVRVRGTTASGLPFVDVAHTLDISRHGARITGLHHPLGVGSEVILQRGANRASFRVCWTRKSPEGAHTEFGLECLDPERNLWKMESVEPELDTFITGREAQDQDEPSNANGQSYGTCLQHLIEQLEAFDHDSVRLIDPTLASEFCLAIDHARQLAQAVNITSESSDSKQRSLINRRLTEHRTRFALSVLEDLNRRVWPFEGEFDNANERVLELLTTIRDKIDVLLSERLLTQPAQSQPQGSEHLT